MNSKLKNWLSDEEETLYLRERNLNGSLNKGQIDFLIVLRALNLQMVVG